MEDNKNNNSNKQEAEEKDTPTSQPNPETLHKTDPQENMRGPLSSLLNKGRKNIEEKGEEYVDGEGDDKQ